MESGGGNFADYGIVGLMLFMVFQYVIKPIIQGFLEKRKAENGKAKGHNPGPEIHKMLEILSKTDDLNRPLVWGFPQREAIDRLTTAVNNLTNAVREGGSLE